MGEVGPVGMGCSGSGMGSFHFEKHVGYNAVQKKKIIIHRPGNLKVFEYYFHRVFYARGGWG